MRREAARREGRIVRHRARQLALELDVRVHGAGVAFVGARVGALGALVVGDDAHHRHGPRGLGRRGEPGQRVVEGAPAHGLVAGRAMLAAAGGVALAAQLHVDGDDVGVLAPTPCRSGTRCRRAALRADDLASATATGCSVCLVPGARRGREGEQAERGHGSAVAACSLRGSPAVRVATSCRCAWRRRRSTPRGRRRRRASSAGPGGRSSRAPWSWPRDPCRRSARRRPRTPRRRAAWAG